MTMVTIKAKPFLLPNFVQLEIPNLPGQVDLYASIDVGQAFPTDGDAARFWEESRERWICHVRQRRDELGKTGEPK